MKIQVYATYDMTAEVYSQPFFAVNKPTAIRLMTNCVNDPKQQHTYHLNPQDFTLYHIAEYNDEDGQLTPIREKVCDLLALRKDIENEQE